MSAPLFDEFDTNVTRPDTDQTDFAGLLSRVYRITDAAVTELETSGDPNRIKALANKINALVRLGKMLPMLQKAEQNAHIADASGKPLQDWSTDELRAALNNR